MNHSIISTATPMDYQTLTDTITKLKTKYPFLEILNLGKSILGREIPLLKLGKGKKHILMIGAHHGMEWITTMLLLRYAEDLCESTAKRLKRYQYDICFCMETHTILLVPMLNPDGVEYQIHGVERSNPLYERLIKMNGDSEDFSHWQANARGVDLNHNYNCGFEEYKKLETENRIFSGAPTRYSGTAPESEPETFALCKYIRFDDQIRYLLTFHSQGEEIYYKSGNVVAPQSEALAKKLEILSGYRLSNADGLAAYGGLTDWYIREFQKPSFTIECGFGTNPLPITDFPDIYERLREMLFTAPMLV